MERFKRGIVYHFIVQTKGLCCKCENRFSQMGKIPGFFPVLLSFHAQCCGSEWKRLSVTATEAKKRRHVQSQWANDSLEWNESIWFVTVCVWVCGKSPFYTECIFSLFIVAVSHSVYRAMYLSSILLHFRNNVQYVSIFPNANVANAFSWSSPLAFHCFIFHLRDSIRTPSVRAFHLCACCSFLRFELAKNLHHLIFIILVFIWSSCLRCPAHPHFHQMPSDCCWLALRYRLLAVCARTWLHLFLSPFDGNSPSSSTIALIVSAACGW